MVPPSPTDTRDLSCITFSSSSPKQRQKASGWRKCRTAQITWPMGGEMRVT